MMVAALSWAYGVGFFFRGYRAKTMTIGMNERTEKQITYIPVQKKLEKKCDNNIGAAMAGY